MFNKKCLMVFTFLILLTISSASAADDLNDNILSVEQQNEEVNLDVSVEEDYDASSDSNEIINVNDVPNENDILLEDSDTVESFENLTNMLNEFSEGSTVTLENNYQYNPETDAQWIKGIEIKSLTIDGQNHYIDANNLSAIFNVIGNNVLLKNIAFINANFTNGFGGAIFSSGENLTIENCTFENNFAYLGGAAYINNSAVIRNSRFINNKGLYGGAVYLENTTNTTIVGSTFYNNSAFYSGGAVFVENSAVFTDSSFINNSAYEGGALYIANITNITKCNISKCIFDGNLADTGASIYIKNPSLPSEEEGDDTEPDPGDDTEPDEGDDGEYDPDAFPDDAPDELEEWDATTYITNCIFKNSNNFIRGDIYLEGDFHNLVFIVINDTVFENMSAEYAPAIYTNNWVFINMTNCSFKNLHANKTGGAAAFLTNSLLTLSNCTFTNTSSSNNGGAIFFDSNGQDYSSIMTLRVLNCSFSNCSSDFGGAIAHIGSCLRIVNSSFTDNFATYDGGAVYSSDAYYDIYIYDSNFTNNKLNFTSDEGLSSGGALFVSFTGYLSINNTRFINNSNQAAYVYESRLRLNNSYFENNGEAVCQILKIEDQIGENNFTTDIFTDLDEDPLFILIGEGEGIQLKLINNTMIIDEKSLPEYFNSVEWGWISPIKNQGISGGCWCFATIAVLESGLLKSTGVLYDFSEQNMQKLMLSYSKYGHEKLVEGGFTTVSILYALSWLGPINENEDTFDEIGKFTRVIPGKRIHVQDLILIPKRGDSYNISAIKEAIMKCGSITTDFLSIEDDINFNSETNAFYCNLIDDAIFPNHAVSIIGWDDNYSKENFATTPPGDGAWIIKNSYGTNSYDNGFVYVSYYDTIIFKNDALGILFENTENYTKNYQTGIGGEVEIVTEAGDYSYKNSYNAIDDDYLSAIGTYFSTAGEDYSFEIYVNGELKLSQDGKAPFCGYHTIKLETQIPIKKGDEFTVVMKAHSAPILYDSKMKYKEGISFIDEGSGWTDLASENSTIVMKVYTMDNPRQDEDTRLESQIVVKNITVTAQNSGKGILEISLKTVDGKPLSYKELEVFFNNQAIKLSTDVGGIAKLSFNLNKAGSYPVNIAYLGDDSHKGSFATAKVTIKAVKTSLTASKKTYLATLKTKKFTAKLKDANGKALSKKTVTFTVNGKTYKVKTNKKGVASVKLKLTKAKTYTLKIKFAGDNVYAASSKTVKIKLKKEKTKLKAPKKTFKRFKKVKKLTVTLKNSKGKAISKKKVVLTVNKKKYTAKTNKKGKATFKIKKFYKKGTKKYTVKFAGDTQYKACKKTGKIKLK